MATIPVWLPIHGGERDPTNGPGYLRTTAGRKYLSFDGTTDELVIWTFPAPSGLTGIDTRVIYSMDTATTNNVATRAEVMATADGENIETDNFASVEKSSDQTVPANATHMKTITDSLGTPTFGSYDYIAIRLGRENATTGTNATGDMLWWAILLELTTS